MKISKRLLSLMMAILVLISCVAVSSTTAFAAKGDKVYCKASFTPNCYMWNNSNDSLKNEDWPGVAMEALGDGVYCYEVPSDDYDMIIFNGNGSQSPDEKYPGGNQIYDYATGKWDVYDLSSSTPIISCTKKSGSSFLTDTVDVTVTVRNAESAYYQIDSGSKVNITGESVTVTMGSGVAIGNTTTLKVHAENANGAVDESYTYTRKDASTLDDGATSAPLGGYYATNPNNQVGKQASITVDGDPSEWDSSMIIAQGVANDDPRVYRDSSMHEIPVDDYALYAAWDNSNLYLMWEMANVQDDVAPNDDFPLTQGNLWIYNLPVFFYFSTDSTIMGDGTVESGATLWDSGIILDAHIDKVVAISTNGSNGPFVYNSNDEGKIVYNDTRQSSINIKWNNGILSKELWGIDEAYGHYNNRKPGDTLIDSSKWKDFYAGTKHKKALDMCYEMSIPLDLLGVSAADLTATGIGLMKVSTYGTSGMNCLPADPSMWDNATKDYSKDESTSMEKEDEDHITVPLARIGKMGTTGGDKPIVQPTVNPPVKPTETAEPTNPVESQTPTSSGETPKPPVIDPTEIDPTKVLLGDTDGDGKVTITDATIIQRHLAKLSVASFNEKAANVDEDKEVSISDATNIQRFLAKLSTNTRVNQYI